MKKKTIIKDFTDVGDGDIEDCLPFFPVKNRNYKTDPPIAKKSKRMERFEKNVPFFVHDILQLQIRSDMEYKDKLETYGTKFETVTVYGNCFLNNYEQFKLDDGTGSIHITYSSKRNRKHSAINQLRIELDNRIHSSNKTKKISDIELNESLNNILTSIEKSTEIRTTPYKNGTRVFVIGRPYFNSAVSEIRIFAYEIKVDDSQNRDKEIFFKRDILRYYESYFKSKKI